MVYCNQQQWPERKPARSIGPRFPGCLIKANRRKQSTMDQLFTTRPALGAHHHEIATPELRATRGLAAAALRIIGLLALATLLG